MLLQVVRSSFSEAYIASGSEYIEYIGADSGKYSDRAIYNIIICLMHHSEHKHKGDYFKKNTPFSYVFIFF